MWFINDITIRKRGRSEAEVLKLCVKNGIKTGNAFCKKKWLGRTVSDDDYPILIEALDNYVKEIHNRTK